MTQKPVSPASQRPISPFMLGSTYRLQLTSVLSFTHRLTGLALVVGTLFLVGWIWSAAYSPDCFEGIGKFFTSVIGKLMLFGWSYAFYFHLCNGVRHLFWDIGKGFEIPAAYRSGYAVVAVSIVLTAITWLALIPGGESQ
jgi:succinate dehydrogenase / fumarate reductase cytochrome b subunit